MKSVMKVLMFGFKKPGPGKVSWVRYLAVDEANAIKQMRAEFGRDVEPYAGPIPEHCKAPGNCTERAVNMIGSGGGKRFNGGWLPVCEKHKDGYFHWGSVR